MFTLKKEQYEQISAFLIACLLSLAALSSCSDYEPMAELHLAEHDLTPNKSILLFESLKQSQDDNIHTFQISMFGASYLAGVCARQCSERTPPVLLANNTDSPINVAKDGFVAGYGSDCDVEYLADDWTGYVSASLAYRKMSDWAVDYDFIFPVAGGSTPAYTAIPGNLNPHRTSLVWILTSPITQTGLRVRSSSILTD